MDEKEKLAEAFDYETSLSGLIRMAVMDKEILGKPNIPLHQAVMERRYASIDAVLCDASPRLVALMHIENGQIRDSYEALYDIYPGHRIAELDPALKFSDLADALEKLGV